MAHHRRPLAKAYNVAIFCALDVERTAILRVINRFDEDPDFYPYPQKDQDKNSYTPGLLGRHLVIVIKLVQSGKVAATGAVSTVKSTFPEIKFCVLVGVCGGAPKNLQNQDIVLGDVIVSTRIFVSDRGRMTDGGLETYDDHDNLPNKLGKAFKGLIDRCRSDADQPRIEREINELMDAHQRDFAQLEGYPEAGVDGIDRIKKYLYPTHIEDRLFQHDFEHRHHLPGICNHCEQGETKHCRHKPCSEMGCDRVSSKIISRRRLELGKRPDVRLHFGPFACADHVLRTAQQRNRLSVEYDAIGFEMEGAGIWDELPTIVIKGVSDYADGHKNKDFQGYAATSSAKAVQVLMRHLPPIERPDDDRIDLKMPGTPGFNEIPLAEIYDIRSIHSHLFLNRQEELGKLSKIFCSKSPLAVAGVRALLIGPPGCGKTALYEKLYERAKEYYWAWWIINCQSEDLINDSLVKFASSFVRSTGSSVASGLPQPPPEACRRAAIEQIKAQNKPWSLILNDVDDGDLVKNILEDLFKCPWGSFLIVSRDNSMHRHFSIPTYNTVRLRGLPEVPESYGVSLFMSIIGEDFDLAGSEASCLELVRRLDHLPEAIRLAATYLRVNPVEASSQYLSDQMRGFLRIFELPEEQSKMGIFHELFAKFTDKLRADDASPIAEDALSLLHVLAFVSSDHIAYSTLETALKNWDLCTQQNRNSEKSIPDAEHTSWFLSPIRIDWLWKAVRDALGQSPDKPSPAQARRWPRISWLDSEESSDEKKKMLGKALLLLERYGLVDWSRNTGTIAVKRLIQQCSFESIINTQIADLYAVRSLIMLCHCVESRYDEQSRSSRRLLHRHFEAHRQKFPDLGKLFDLLDVVSALVLCMRISLTYYEHGDIATAKRIQELAVEKARPKINEMEFDEFDLMLKARSQLAASLFDLDGWGDREQAAAIRLEVKECRERLWLNNQENNLYHRLYIGSLADLADSYDYIPNRTSQAVVYRQQVIDEKRKLSRKKSEDMTEAKQRLAQSCFRDGQRNRALTLRKEIWNACISRRYSHHHRQEPLDEQYLSALSDLADSLCSLGHWLEAMEMRQEVLEVRKSRLEPQHYDIMVAKSNLSISHMKMRQYEKAIELREEIFLQYEKAYSLKNGLTLRAYCQLAHAVGRSDGIDFGPMKAFAMYREAMEIWEDLTPCESPSACSQDRIDTMTSMADVLQRYMSKNPSRKFFPVRDYLPGGMKIADEAVRLRVKIHEMLSEQHGENDPIVLVAQNAIADCYMASGRLGQALELRDQVLTKWRKSTSHEVKSDVRYQMAVRSQARTYDLLAAYWAPTGGDFYKAVVPPETAEHSDDKGEVLPWNMIVQQRYERSGTWRSSHSSDRMSGYGSEHGRMRTGYLEAACSTWRELFNLQEGLQNSEGDDENTTYEVLRTMQDLGDALVEYNNAAVELEEQGREAPLVAEARGLWTRAREILAKPERLGPAHPEVLALTERIESLEALPSAEVDRIEDWISHVVDGGSEVQAEVQADAMVVTDNQSMEPISSL